MMKYFLVFTAIIVVFSCNKQKKVERQLIPFEKTIMPDQSRPVKPVKPGPACVLLVYDGYKHLTASDATTEERRLIKDSLYKYGDKWEFTFTESWNVYNSFPENKRQIVVFHQNSDGGYLGKASIGSMPLGDTVFPVTVWLGGIRNNIPGVPMEDHEQAARIAFHEILHSLWLLHQSVVSVVNGQCNIIHEYAPGGWFLSIPLNDYYLKFRTGTNIYCDVQDDTKWIGLIVKTKRR